MNGDSVMDFKAFLADLRARRAALDQAITALEALDVSGALLVAPAASGGLVGAASGIEPGFFFNLNTVDATKKYLNFVGKAQSTKQIGDALRKGSLNVKDDSVAAILQRRVRDDDEVELVSVSRGMWGLKRFYGK